MSTKMIALAGMIAAFGVGAAHADSVAYSSGRTALRAEPSSQSDAVATVPANTEIDVRGCHDRWCYAQVGDASGYIARDRVAFNDEGRTVRPAQHEEEYVHPGLYSGPQVYGSDYNWGTSDFRDRPVNR